jgi:hypothetical protein
MHSAGLAGRAGLTCAVSLGRRRGSWAQTDASRPTRSSTAAHTRRRPAQRGGLGRPRVTCAKRLTNSSSFECASSTAGCSSMATPSMNETTSSSSAIISAMSKNESEYASGREQTDSSPSAPRYAARVRPHARGRAATRTRRRTVLMSTSGFAMARTNVRTTWLSTSCLRRGHSSAERGTVAPRARARPTV